jgi:hypothetical protein
MVINAKQNKFNVSSSSRHVCVCDGMSSFEKFFDINFAHTHTHAELIIAICVQSLFIFVERVRGKLHTLERTYCDSLFVHICIVIYKM